MTIVINQIPTFDTILYFHTGSIQIKYLSLLPKLPHSYFLEMYFKTKRKLEMQCQILYDTCQLTFYNIMTKSSFKL